MKKRMIAVIMAAMMTMSLAACGSKDSGGSTPGTEPTVEDGDSKEETSVPDGQIADEADGSESDSAEESDAQDSQPAEEESSEATNTQNLPDNYDWASVDWERVVWTYEDTSQLRTSGLIDWASQIQASEVTPKEYLDNSISIKYDELDEETKTILDKLVELTSEERQAIYLLTGLLPDNYDWASVDWGRIIVTTSDGRELRAAVLTSIAWRAAANRMNEGSEDATALTSEAVINSGEFEYFGITSYDELDEESRMLLEKMDELWINKVDIIRTYVML